MELTDYALGIELPTDGEYVCNAISTLNFDKNLVGVTLTEFEGSKKVQALMMPDNDKYLDFIDQRVTVEFKQEIVSGVSVVYIKNFTQIKEVALIPTDTLFKLYLDKDVTIGTDTVFKDLAMSKEYKALKLYCVKNTYNASTRSYWSEYRLMDKYRKVMIGRCFKPISDAPDHTGKYIIADVVRTKYGLNLDNIHPITRESVAINPIVGIAKQYVVKAVNKMSSTAQIAIEKSGLINYLETALPDEDLEVGFDLVKIAISLSMLEPFKNISKDLDIKTMQEALVLRYIYKLNNDDKLSKTINTVLTLARYGALKSKKLLTILGDEPEEYCLERDIYNRILDTTNIALKATISEVK